VAKPVPQKLNPLSRYDQLLHERDLAAYAIVGAVRSILSSLNPELAGPLSDLLAVYDNRVREAAQFSQTPEYRQAKREEADRG
jgi:hypothetical protein